MGILFNKVKIVPNSHVTPTPTVTPTSSVTPTPSITPTSSITPTPTVTPTNTVTPTSSVTPTNTVTPTSSVTPTNTVTPTIPIPITGYEYNLVVLPYQAPTSGNTIFPTFGTTNNSGTTNPNTFTTNGVYWNTIDNTSVDRTNYYSGMTGVSVTAYFTQNGNTVIYSGSTSAFTIEGPPGQESFNYNPGTRPNQLVLIQSASGNFVTGQTVYISYTVNGAEVTPTPTPTSTPTQTPTPTPTPDVTVFNVTNSGASAYTINGSSNPTLTLREGQTYTFNVSAGGHPFFIKTSPVTGTGSAYNDGVTNNGTESGTITFVVPYNAPSTLYYICRYHGSMVGTINIIDVSV